jgi:hypothetical protein
MERVSTFIAVALLSLNGLGACFGGIMLMTDPSGNSLHLPIRHLQHSPFADYFIPGAVLFVANGLLSLLALWAIFRNWASAPMLTMIQGFVLTIWITVQIQLIQLFYLPFHLPFILMGLTLAVIVYCRWISVDTPVKA